MEKPKPKPDFDPNEIVKLTDAHLTNVATGDADMDDPFWVFKDILKVIYGDDVDKWLDWIENK